MSLKSILQTFSLNLFQLRKQLIYPFRFPTLIFFIFFSSALFGQIAPVEPPKGGFKIDGYLRANITTPAGDWVPRINGTAFTAGVDSFVLTSDGIPEDSVTTRLKRDLYNNNDDTIFAQGSKFNDHISALHWSTGSPPDKNDIHNGLFHAAGNPENGDQWVIIAGDRYAINGTSYIDFEFLQDTILINSNGTFTGLGPNGGRTIGDINISMEYNNGGSAPKVVIYRWKLLSGTTYFWDSTGSSAITQAFAQTNLTTVDVPFGAFGSSTYQAYAFVEAAINVTELLSLDSVNCGGLSIKTLWIKTKASSTSTAALKDFMNPISVNLNFGAVDIDQKGPVCVDGSSITLTGTPSGGTFSGPGVTGSTFTPSTAGVGTHKIFYQASAGAGCIKSDSMYIVVNPKPSVSVDSATICASDSSATLTATPSGSASPFDFSWTVPGGTNPGNVASFPAYVAGIYSVFVTDTNGCTSPLDTGTLTINPNPVAPSVSISQPTCGNSNGTVTVTAPLDGGGNDYQYNNNDGAWQDNVDFTVAANDSFRIKAKNVATGCVSTITRGKMGVSESVPAPLVIFLTNPSCSSSTGTLKIVKMDSSYYDTGIFEFSNDGTSWTSDSVFTFTAGAGYKIFVRRISDTTCIDSTSCESEEPPVTSRSANPEATARVLRIAEDESIGVKAMPNPFNDRVRLLVTSKEGGDGTLEIFNILGQKVKTVYQGYIPSGSNYFDVSLPAQQRASLIYVLRMGGQKVTGQLLQLNTR